MPQGAGFGSRATLAALLAVALLFCHGVFGASHVLAHDAPAHNVSAG